MRPFKTIDFRFFVIFLSATLFLCTGCTETTRRARPLVIDTPAYSSDGIGADSSSGLTQKTTKEMTSAGFAYLAAGNGTMARIHFISALKKDDSNPWAYIGLGDISYLAGDYPSAQANYDKAASLDESNLAAILGQSQSLRQQGKSKEAMKMVEKAKALGPNDVRVLTEQAINYDLQGEEELATPIYQEIAKRTPEQASAFNNIGVNELSQGHYAESISNFSKAYLLDGKDMRIANNLAMAFALYGQEDQAIKIFTKSIGVAAAWNNLGYIYMTQGKFDEAEIALNKAIELNPKFYERAQENLDRLEQLRLTKTREQSSPAPPTFATEPKSTQPQPEPQPVPASEPVAATSGGDTPDPVAAPVFDSSATAPKPAPVPAQIDTPSFEPGA